MQVISVFENKTKLLSFTCQIIKKWKRWNPHRWHSNRNVNVPFFFFSNENKVFAVSVLEEQDYILTKGNGLLSKKLYLIFIPPSYNNLLTHLKTMLWQKMLKASNHLNTPLPKILFPSKWKSLQLWNLAPGAEESTVVWNTYWSFRICLNICISDLVHHIPLHSYAS